MNESIAHACDESNLDEIYSTCSDVTPYTESIPIRKREAQAMSDLASDRRRQAINRSKCIRKHI